MGESGIIGLVKALVSTQRQFDLMGVGIGDSGVAVLMQCEWLSSLDLGFNNVGPNGAHMLAAHEGLTRLVLFGNPIGDEGAIAFTTNTKVTYINLGDCQIGDRGLVALHHWREKRAAANCAVEIKAIDLSEETILKAKMRISQEIIKSCGISQSASGRVPD